jgi:hypothetical protein
LVQKVWLCRGNLGNLKIPFDFFCHASESRKFR